VLAQLTFYALCLALWLFFRHTKCQQRRRWLYAILWAILLIGAVGMAAEIWMRGGALPISW
jgi:peptidoglycan/LPS O-acetylase OafA/YrhL